MGKLHTAPIGPQINDPALYRLPENVTYTVAESLNKGTSLFPVQTHNTWHGTVGCCPSSFTRMVL